MQSFPGGSWLVQREDVDFSKVASALPFEDTQAPFAFYQSIFILLDAYVPLLFGIVPVTEADDFGPVGGNRV